MRTFMLVRRRQAIGGCLRAYHRPDDVKLRLRTAYAAIVASPNEELCPRTRGFSFTHSYFFRSNRLTPLRSRKRVVLSSGALEHDRTWAFFDSSGKFVNGKRFAAATAAARALRFGGAGRNAASMRTAEGLGNRTFSSMGDGDVIEKWLNDYFGFPVTFKKNTDLGFPLLYRVAGSHLHQRCDAR